MTHIRSSAFRAMVDRLTRDREIDAKDVLELIETAQGDKALSVSERQALQGVLDGPDTTFDDPATKQRLQAYLSITDSQLRHLAHKLEADGDVIDLADAEKIVQLADKDGRLTEGERFSLRALMVGSKLTPDAEERLGGLAAAPDEAPESSPMLQASTPNRFIPDAGPDGIVDTLRFEGSGTVADLKVDLDIEHRCRSDLRVSLIGPDGTEVVLHDRTGGMWKDLIGVVPDDIEPVEPLRALKDIPLAGEWSLKVVDARRGNTGYLRGWKLAITPRRSVEPGPEGLRLGAADSGQPVYLSQAGFFVEQPGEERPEDATALGSGLYRMADLVDDARANPFVAHPLSLELRTQIFANLEEALDTVPPGAEPPEGLSEQQALQLRSSAVTVLRELMLAAGIRGDEGAFKQAAFDSYVELVRAEQNPVLRDSMIFQLDLRRERLTPEMQKITDTLMQELAPTSPPYAQWFADGNRTLNVSLSCGEGIEGFYAGNVHALKQRGFVPVEPEHEGGPCTYAKTITSSAGEPHEVRITVRTNQDDFLDNVDDPDVHIIATDMHSSFGRSVTSALESAPEEKGSKLIMPGMCASKDAVHYLQERFPSSQLLSTFTSAYFSTEEVDGERRSKNSENLATLLVLCEDAVERAPWEQINEDIKRKAINQPLMHVMPGGTNYISPIHTQIRGRLLDQDHDGQADALDKLVSFNTFRPEEDTAHEFAPQEPGRDASRLDGTKAHIACMALNTQVGYNAVTRRYREGNIVSAGHFTPETDRDPVVRFIREGTRRHPTFRLQVNANYAHMSQEALRAVVQYAFVQEIGDEHKYAANRPETLSATDKKLLGLIFAASSLMRDSLGSTTRDSEIWKGLLARYNLPADLKFSDARGLLQAEHHHYTGNLDHVEKWKARLPADLLEQLERDDVGVIG